MCPAHILKGRKSQELLPSAGRANFPDLTSSLHVSKSPQRRSISTSGRISALSCQVTGCNLGAVGFLAHRTLPCSQGGGDALTNPVYLPFDPRRRGEAGEGFVGAGAVVLLSGEVQDTIWPTTHTHTHTLTVNDAHNTSAVSGAASRLKLCTLNEQHGAILRSTISRTRQEKTAWRDEKVQWFVSIKWNYNACHI